MSAQIGCTIIVPLLVNNTVELSFIGPRDLLRYYDGLIRSADSPFEVLLLDNSPGHIAERLQRICEQTAVRYAYLPDSERVPGNNQKMDAVLYGLHMAQTEKILLFDDDIRPTLENIRQISSDLDRFTFVKCIIDIVGPDLLDKIDLAGIYVYNLLSRYGQTWANISFRKSALLKRGYPRRDVLYDELAIERTLRQATNQFYRRDTPIPLKSGDRFATVRGRLKYIEQRRRYAYENLALPFRFACDLAVLPVLACIGIYWGTCAALGAAATLTCAMCLFSYWYEASLQYQSAAGRVWPFAAVWYWPYPVFSWFALLFDFITGGIFFGASKIWRASICLRCASRGGCIETRNKPWRLCIWRL